MTGRTRRRPGDAVLDANKQAPYEQAGFTEVVRRSPTRVVMRRALHPGAAHS